MSMQKLQVLGLVLAVVGCHTTSGDPPKAETPLPSETEGPARAEVDWQRTADDALRQRGESGAIVILDAEDGEVLAVAELAGRVEHPATVARNPASTIKPFLAHAALAEGTAGADDAFVCPTARDGLECFDEHGEVDLAKGLRTSCNHYAFALADRLPWATLRPRLVDLGLANVPELGSHAESIGHGDLSATPVELAQAYRALARDELPGDPSAGAAVREALAEAVARDDGTGAAARISNLRVAGKTGTSHLDPSESDDARYSAWFAGWAPADAPEVVVVVMLESADPASASAAVVARSLFAKLLDG